MDIPAGFIELLSSESTYDILKTRLSSIGDKDAIFETLKKQIEICANILTDEKVHARVCECCDRCDGEKQPQNVSSEAPDDIGESLPQARCKILVWLGNVQIASLFYKFSPARANLLVKLFGVLTCLLVENVPDYVVQGVFDQSGLDRTYNSMVETLMEMDLSEPQTVSDFNMELMDVPSAIIVQCFSYLSFYELLDIVSVSHRVQDMSRRAIGKLPELAYVQACSLVLSPYLARGDFRNLVVFIGVPCNQNSDEVDELFSKLLCNCPRLESLKYTLVPMSTFLTNSEPLPNLTAVDQMCFDQECIPKIAKHLPNLRKLSLVADIRHENIASVDISELFQGWFKLDSLRYSSCNDIYTGGIDVSTFESILALENLQILQIPAFLDMNQTKQILGKQNNIETALKSLSIGFNAIVGNGFPFDVFNPAISKATNLSFRTEFTVTDTLNIFCDPTDQKQTVIEFVIPPGLWRGIFRQMHMTLSNIQHFSLNLPDTGIMFPRSLQMNSLTTLDISGMNIKRVLRAFVDADGFCHTPNLTELNLKTIKTDEQHAVYLTSFMSGLHSLTLDLDTTPVNSIVDVFTYFETDCTTLIRLELIGGRVGRSFFEVIFGNGIWGLFESLQHLSIAFGEDIPHGFLQYLPEKFPALTSVCVGGMTALVFLSLPDLFPKLKRIECCRALLVALSRSWWGRPNIEILANDELEASVKFKCAPKPAWYQRKKSIIH
eukprot:240894_1